MSMPEWMKDLKLASDPAWSLTRAWYVGEVCERIMMMTDEQGLVKSSQVVRDCIAQLVVDLLLDPDVNTMKQHYDRLKRMQEVI
jgi:hypothetical protein